MTNEPVALAEGAPAAAAVPCERCGGFTPEHELAVVGTQRLCQACQALRRAEIAIHPYQRLLLFGVLTSPAVALWLLANNASRLGEQREAWVLRALAVGLVVVAFGGNLVDGVPGTVVLAIQFGALLFASSRWKDRLDKHLLLGGARAALLPTILGVIAAVVFMMLVAGTLLMVFRPATG
ncbi:MAG: hypothetical protein MUC96_07585 [Myxococcaceae bacterium]|jgi:hypothetical protein|nr:hypothetical protein [Myxococcaceae bacterium]